MLLKKTLKFWDISIYNIGSINGVVFPVYDWLNLKFEKQWQDWMTGGYRYAFECCIVNFLTIFTESVEQNVTEKYLLL